MNKTIILPTGELGKLLCYRTKQFCQQYGLGVLEEDFCIELIIALVDDKINQVLHWCQATDNVHDLLMSHCAWFHLSLRDDEGKEYVLSELFFTDVLDFFEVLVSENLINIIDAVPEGRWRVWHLTRLDVDTVLECSQDYRVLEFERLLKQGKVHLPKSTKRRGYEKLSFEFKRS